MTHMTSPADVLEHDRSPCHTALRIIKKEEVNIGG